jgi:xylose isomerase
MASNEGRCKRFNGKNYFSGIEFTSSYKAYRYAATIRKTGLNCRVVKEGNKYVIYGRGIRD